MVFGHTATTENGTLDSRIDPSDPMAREAQTFPIVSEEMATRIARYGSEERFEARAPEGLQTIVVESMAPGGQAGTSSKIENYLGFPTGISGAALAGRAQVQAQKFGARLALSRAAVGLDCDGTQYSLELDDGERIRARAIVVATGARYRKLDLAGCDRFEGAGIYYAATAMEASLCAGEEVLVVGGGNSAGRAAVFLAGSVKHVYMLVRGSGLAATMSDYLVQRIERSERISLHPRSEVTPTRNGPPAASSSTPRVASAPARRWARTPIRPTRRRGLASTRSATCARVR